MNIDEHSQMDKMKGQYCKNSNQILKKINFFNWSKMKEFF